MLSNISSLTVSIICLTTVFLILHINRNGTITIGIKLLFGLLILSSLVVFSNFGRFHYLKKDTPEFVSATGSQTKNSYFHWHEIYHYYLGAKYYKENGHYGLYNSFVLADRESDNPKLTVNYMRDSVRKLYNISTDEGAKRASEIHRPKFTDERWNEFKRDIEYMKSIAIDGWADLGLYDAGFNPPPTWSVFGYIFANIMPMSDSWFDYGPTWDQAEFLPMLDVLLMLIAFIFLWRCFGYIPAAIFAISFFTGYLSNSHWVAGSFLRHTWLFYLIMTLCFIKQKKFLPAGIFMALCCLDRIFPLVFAFGIGVAMLSKWRNKEISFDTIKKFAIGFLATCFVMISISIFMFGFSAWVEFFEMIKIHKSMFFIAHIGYQKFALFDSWVANQNFWGPNGMDVFRNWNQRLHDKWDAVMPYHFPFMMVILGSALLAARKIEIEESAILVGGVILFLFEIPANYYYSYLALAPMVVFMAMKNDRLHDLMIIFVFFAVWIAINIIPNYQRDDIINTYHYCTLLLIFFLFWPLSRIVDLEAIKQILEYKPSHKFSKKHEHE